MAVTVYRLFTVVENVDNYKGVRVVQLVNALNQHLIINYGLIIVPLSL